MLGSRSYWFWCTVCVRKRRIDVRVRVELSMPLFRVVLSTASCAFSRCIVGHVSCWRLTWQGGHRHRCGGTGRWGQVGVDTLSMYPATVGGK